MPPILIWLFIEDSEYLQPYSSIHLKFSKNFYKDSSLKKSLYGKTLKQLVVKISVNKLTAY